MKKVFLALTALVFFASQYAFAQYVKSVDPRIGSDDHGHVFVGANVPWGMVNVGPVQPYHGWDWCSGYHASGDSIIGFSHTHLSGTGCSDLGDITLMPMYGYVRTNGTREEFIEDIASRYSHANEVVEPGYYSVKVMAYGNDLYETSNQETVVVTKEQSKIYLRNALYFVTETKMVKVTLWDGKNKPIAGKTVHIKVYDSLYSGVTDKDGNAYIRVGIGFSESYTLM
jgi:putative alpha-1,2-mannosidase